MNINTEAVWIDLLNPSKEEIQQVEKTLGIKLPTRAEMHKIDLSSRLYRDNNNIFMTALIIANSDSPRPKLAPVTFILTPNKLITIRYTEPQAFNLFLSRFNNLQLSQQPVHDILVELLEVIVDRLADILELVGHQLDELSETIFRSDITSKSKRKLNYRQFLHHVGIYGDLNTKARESLITLNRLVLFFEQIKGQHRNLNKDLESLSSHADFMANKVNFLLDAILGMVNIDQNNTIRILSVAAVVFLPPTLIASIYGMNFKFIPELSWRFGYPLAIGMILLAAWLPYKYFKKRNWL